MKKCDCCDHPLEHAISRAMDQVDNGIPTRQAWSELRETFEEWREETAFKPGRCLIGGSFSDETGWWVVDEVYDDGSVTLLDKNAEARWTTVDHLPPLEYLEEHCTHPGGCYKPPFPF